MSIKFVKDTIKDGLKPYESIFKKNRVMVAGGVLTSLFTKHEVNDVDCYFRSKKDLVSFIADVAADSCYPYFINVTDKSMTLSANGCPTIQLIYFKFFNDLSEVFKVFDFTISMCGYDYAKDEVEYHEDFFSDLSQRRLSFNKDTAFPLISGIRVNKFRDRGFTISRNQMMKVMLAVSKVKITTVEEFVQQVGGQYGNAALTLLADDKDFNLESAMEKLSKIENESQINGLMPNSGVIISQQTDTMPLNVMGSILMSLNPFRGGWYRCEPKTSPDGSQRCTRACYVDGDGRKQYIPLSVALLFAKGNERKKEDISEEATGIYYKYVKKTSDPMVFSSHYDPTFKYKIGEKASDNNVGLFVCNSEQILEHHYRRYRDVVVLICSVKIKDFVYNKHCDNLLTKSLNVIGVLTEEPTESNLIISSPMHPGTIALDKSPEISNEEIDEDEIEEAFSLPVVNMKGPVDTKVEHAYKEDAYSKKVLLPSILHSPSTDVS